MAAEPVFVDTNVLVYVTRPSAQHHVAAKDALAKLEFEGCALWIGPQVVREYLAVVTRPQSTNPPLPMAAALADVEGFRATFEMADEKLGVLDRLLDLLATGRSSGRQCMMPTLSPLCWQMACVASSRSTPPISGLLPERSRS